MISKVYNWLSFDQYNRCLLCLGSAAGSPDSLCSACLSDLPWLSNPCRQCALPLPAPDMLCGRCQQYSPAYAQVVAPFLYLFPIDSLIPAFKHRQQLTYGRLLARLLHQAVAHHYEAHQLQLPDYVIPVPLHRARQAQRGYNQALELARPIAQQLGVKLDRTNLLRQRATESQQDLDAQARRQNLEDAFHCRYPQRLADMHVALVDDVVTTGTTAHEASRTLLASGAASVTIWCVARTGL